MCCHPAITLSCLCVRNEATTGGQFTKLDRPTGLLFKICLVLTWDLMWITSMGNHGAAEGISECRHSSCYASAFRRQRHYVFGLSVRPSVHRSEAWNTLFWPLHGSVGPPDQPWPCPSVRPNVWRGFRAFAGERMERMAWNITCWCILTIFKTD